MSVAPGLILALEGERTQRFDGRREQLFDCRDGSIGRSEECDWVLGSEGVSRLHAVVRYLNGIYFIEDRSTNGMLLNGAPLRRGEPAALKEGDRLQIDTFEVGVRLSREDETRPGGMGEVALATPAASPVQTDTPAPGPTSAALARPAFAADENRDPLDMSLLLRPSHGGALDHGSEAEGLIPGADGPAPGASLDPLALFDAPSSYQDEPPPFASTAQDWNHTPSVADRFRPPQPQAARVDGPMLPEDWDATGYRAAAHAAAASVWQGDVSMAGPAAVGRASQQHESSVADVQAQPTPVPTHMFALATPTPAPAPAPAPASGEMAFALQDKAPATEAGAVALQTATESSVSAPSLPATPAAPMQGVGTTDRDAPPHAPVIAETPSEPAPTSPTTPTPPTTPELDAMFEIAVDAMMDVLRARAELKNSFRLPATLIQRSENNPLKFAPTAKEAVKRLLAPPDGGFLSGSAALADAADDIRNHQMAMLAGVRSAFDSMLAHFDPARIEQFNEGGTRRLPFGGRPRHWERYKEEFEAVTRNPDECFRRLFGDEFARAYEEQLGRLKNRRN